MSNVVEMKKLLTINFLFLVLFGTHPAIAAIQWTYQEDVLVQELVEETKNPKRWWKRTFWKGKKEKQQIALWAWLGFSLTFGALIPMVLSIVALSALNVTLAIYWFGLMLFIGLIGVTFCVKTLRLIKSSGGIENHNRADTLATMGLIVFIPLAILLGVIILSF